MRKFHKRKFIRILVGLPLIFIISSAPTTSSALTPIGYLGAAVNFGVLANTPSISSTGITTISGSAGSQMGIAPAASITDGGTLTSGVQHLNDGAAIAAQAALASAYTTLSTLPVTMPDPGVELGGQSLSPGVYGHGTLGITTTLTLDGGGDPNAIFVFQAATSLITADSVASKVVLINQAQACNVYWTVGSAATLGVGSTFIGHVLSIAAITAKTGANITGQLMSRDAAVTLDANLIANDNCATYTATYSGNGNTGGTVPVDGLSPYNSGSTVTVLTNSGALVKTGNTFTGWNTAADGSGTAFAPAATFSILADTILYAQWTPITYTVLYSGNGSTGGTVPVDGLSPYLTGSSVTVKTNSGALVKSLNAFGGWNTAANGSGTFYSPSNTFTILANTTLYAQWSPVFYTVTFLGNSATSGSTAPQTGNTPAALTSNEFGRTGFTFNNWNTAADGSGAVVVNAATYAFSSNLTLYAQWLAVVVPTPTPTPTPTVSATPTPTPTVSATPTPTPTVSATPTPTPTVSATPTPTPTVSATPTPTPTVSATPTPTPTVSATPTPKVVHTVTGGKLPKTGTPWNNLIGFGGLLIVTGGLAWRRQTR